VNLYKKLCLLLGIFLAAPVFSQAKQENAYQRILNFMRETAPQESHGLAAVAAEAHNKKKKASPLKNHTLSTQALQEHALELLAMHDTQAHNVGDVTFHPHAWDRLDLISGVLPAIDRTKTVFGKLYLARLLTSPTHDITTLRNRQKVIKAFLQRPEKTKKIVSLLSEIAGHQKDMIGLLDPKHPLYDEGIQLVFHKWPPRMLFSLLSKHRYMESFSKMLGDAWFTFGPFLYVWAIKKFWTNIDDIKKDSFSFLGKSFALSEEKNFKLGLKAALAAIILYSIPHMINMVTGIAERGKTIEYMRKQLLPLVSFYSHADTFAQLSKRAFPELALLEGELGLLQKRENPHISQTLSLVLKNPLLKNSALTQLTQGGNLIAAVPQLQDQGKKIFNGIALVAALDAYTALAQFFREQTEELPVCFPNYITLKPYVSVEKLYKHQQRTHPDSFAHQHALSPLAYQPTPYLSTEKFWHTILPVASNDEVITNSITLGGKRHKQNILLTGLPEKGKSTTAKSLALVVLFAQTLGICPARSVLLTPFSLINIYANIKDDLANDRSLFKTEIYECLSIVEAIKNLPPGNVSFTVADEMFKGTEACAGEASSWAVTKYLCGLKNSISVNATNFSSLAQLDTKEDLLTGYYLPVIDVDGEMKPSFRLQRGYQPLAQTTSIFREENYPKEIIADMEHILLNPKEFDQGEAQ